MPNLPNAVVVREDSGPVATLTLNRPDQANTLSEGLLDALTQEIESISADPDIRVVILAANGRIFCAGHDLREMNGQADRGYFEALFTRCSQMMLAIRSCPKPVIAKVQGAAVAAGCQLVATCDLAYAAETARFGVSGIDLGLFCSTPSVALSRTVQPKQALDMLLTGRLIDAHRAAEIGLVNAAVPAAELDGVVHDAAGRIAAKLPAAIGLGKALFYGQLEMDLPEAYALAGSRMADNISDPDTRELIGAFLRR
jgi:enoyl-CoA hydratase/carnithine racemase